MSVSYNDRENDSLYLEIKRLLNEDLTLGKRVLAKKTACTFSQAETRKKWWKQEQLEEEAADPGRSTFNVRGGSATLSFSTGKPIATEEDAIEAGNVDLNKWSVRNCKISFWESGAEQKCAVKLDLERRDYNPEELFRHALEGMKNYTPPAPYVVTRATPLPLMLEIDIMDLHIGKYSWQGETNHNWDIKTAVQSSDDALERLLSLSGGEYELILMPIGNDLLHVDNLLGTTTLGTQQDCDGRVTKMVEDSLDMLVNQIDKLKYLSPVRILIMAGNHDLLVTTLLGIALKHRYWNDDRVEVDTQPISRKYLTWGKCLLGFCHGSKTDPPMRELPAMMMLERGIEFATAVHRHFHIGHLHKGQSLSFWSEDMWNSVVVRRIRSLTVPDLFHYNRGYLNPGARGAESFLWHREDGLIQHNLTYVKERY